VILAASHSDPDREFRTVQSFYERRVDGVLVLASRVGAQYLSWSSTTKSPIVLINSHHRGEFTYSVRIDNPNAAKIATSHLIELGHKRIAYIGDEFGFQSDSERFSGYQKALSEARLSSDPKLVVYGDGTPGSGSAAMSRLLQLPETPTAVFCYNDREALGAMRAVRESGMRVPDDISIVGFDDLFLSSYMDPPLTTIRQPKHEMGRVATEILFGLLNGDKQPKNHLSSGMLIVRQSTAAPRRP
jgi:LacI family transcriptional regulator/LacI family repressor for deo operon, udp, cdd, tsx, nupC, and nupG